MAKPSASRSKQPVKKSKTRVEQGRAYVNATFNNTLVYITDQEGNVLAWATAGGEGFKGSRKSTPFAASQAAKKAGEKAVQTYGLRQIDVYMNGPGPGRESAVKALGDIFRVSMISDVTPIPHNGVRAKKERRV